MFEQIKDYITNNPEVLGLIASNIVTIIWLIVNGQFAKVRIKAYQWVKEAALDERFINESGRGHDKLEAVIERIYGALPAWIIAILPKKMFNKLATKMAQEAYDALEDILDDGKLNGSVIEDEA